MQSLHEHQTFQRRAITLESGGWRSIEGFVRGDICFEDLSTEATVQLQDICAQPPQTNLPTFEKRVSTTGDTTTPLSSPLDNHSAGAAPANIPATAEDHRKENGIYQFISPQRYPQECKCSCHHHSSGFVLLAGGRLGYISYSQTGSVLSRRTCDMLTCNLRSTPTFSAVFCGPRWLSSPAMAVSILNPDRINISLSFPRVLPPDHEFFNCTRKGDIERMKQLLVSGRASPADVSVPYGLSALDLSLFYGHTEASRFLISQGATHCSAHSNWSAKDIWDFYATCSIIGCSISASEVLQDSVYLYSQDWQLKGVQASVEEGKLESYSLSTLHKIVLGLSSEDVNSLRYNSRSVVNEVDSCGRTALYWAACLGNAAMVKKLLLRGADPDLTDFNGASPLHVAASAGSARSIRILVQAGAKIEAPDRLGATPLHYGSILGHVGTIEALLDLGAETDSKTYLNETPIEYANHGRSIEAVKILLYRGASLQHFDSWGFNPILDAVLANAHEPLKLLLEVDWNRTAKLFDGKTILHIAASNSDLRTIETLLNADLTGVKPNALDDAGLSALDYLRRRQDVEELLEPFCTLLLETEKSFQSHICKGTDEGSESHDDVFLDAVEYHLND
jgi:ankyrin repeat protein